MAYAPITPEDFKAAKPQFTNVPDETVQVYLDLAGLWVDESWPDRLYQPAVIAITCHLATLDGLGTDAQSKLFKSGRSDFQSIKSGEVTLTRFQKSAADMTYLDWLGQTQCGAFFVQLLRMAKGGPRIAMGGVGHSQSGYAKDVPFSPPWSYGA